MGQLLGRRRPVSLRQLGLGFLMYLQEYRDCFPTAALKSTISVQPEDWVWSLPAHFFQSSRS